MADRKKVFDPLRRRYVALTPEEAVRQAFVRFLVEERGYPATLSGNEISLVVGYGRQKRCDTVVYSRQLRPLVIVEYKAPSVVIDERVFRQIWRYAMALRAPYLMVSNGHHHYCLRLTGEDYVPLSDIPRYEDLLP